MKKKNEFFTEMAKPFIVLVVICLVASALLGVTNYYTEPVIAANAAAKAEQARHEALPSATSFTEEEVSPELAALGVTGIFVDDGGSGCVVTAANKGYKGDIVLTVGFDPQGNIIALQADVSTETQGVGSKAGKSDYLDKYLGLNGSAEDVDTITGATFSSTAVRDSVNAAMAAFASIQ